ncbi:MAG: hypothetical protein ACXW3Z_05535 [Limisphaerales bacterium]
MKFYTGQGWSDSPMKARDFEGSVHALDYIRENRIGRAQIVLKFERDEFDVVLPSKDCRQSQN